jgi:hypothetical protein
VSLEAGDPGNAGQLRTVVGTDGHDQKTGADVVALVSRNAPALARLVPAQRADLVPNSAFSYKL